MFLLVMHQVKELLVVNSPRFVWELGKVGILKTPSFHCVLEGRLQGIQFYVYNYFPSVLWKYYPSALDICCCYREGNYKSNHHTCLPFLWAVFKVSLCLVLCFIMVFLDMGFFLVIFRIVFHESDGSFS